MEKPQSHYILMLVHVTHESSKSQEHFNEKDTFFNNLTTRLTLLATSEDKVIEREKGEGITCIKKQEKNRINKNKTNIIQTN